MTQLCNCFQRTYVCETLFSPSLPTNLLIEFGKIKKLPTQCSLDLNSAHFGSIKCVYKLSSKSRALLFQSPLEISLRISLSVDLYLVHLCTVCGFSFPPLSLFLSLLLLFPFMCLCCLPACLWHTSRWLFRLSTWVFNLQIDMLKKHTHTHTYSALCTRIQSHTHSLTHSLSN